MFEEILLEPEQKELFPKLVEAARNVPKDKRQKFLVVRHSGGCFVHHPGLPNSNSVACIEDIDILESAGLISVSYGSQGSPQFFVTPFGNKYYSWLKQSEGKPIQNIEETIRKFLNAEKLKEKYLKAFQKWGDAESLLWDSDSESQFTTIGHLCREAMQEFVTVLVENYKPADVDNNKAHTISRLSAVIEHQAKNLGDTEKSFLHALIDYWRRVCDLIQRQEHGGQKEGRSLVWEDARRIVFQMAVIMFEVDSALSRQA